MICTSYDFIFTLSRLPSRDQTWMIYEYNTSLWICFSDKQLKKAGNCSATFYKQDTNMLCKTGCRDFSVSVTEASQRKDVVQLYGSASSQSL